MKALVTGISGFAGGFLAEHLLKSGDEVLGCRRAVGRRPSTASSVLENVTLVAWNIADAQGIPNQTLAAINLFQPQCIFHLAGISVPNRCGRREPTPEARATNVDGTRRVLELAAALEPAPRVLVVSSSHVYARVSDGHDVVDEHAATEPASGYGRTKLAAEELARDYASRGLCAIVARAFQHSGPRQHAEMMLPEWASQFAAAGDEPVRVDNLDTSIDLTDVRDVVRAYRMLIQQGAPGVTYNVGSGVRRRTGDVFRLLRQIAGPNRDFVERKPGRRYDPIADVSRLREATGWRAEIPLEQTVADTLAYWQGRPGLRD